VHLAPLIRDLAVILGVAGLISLFFTRIRQPVVLGYILAGIVIGPHTPPFQLVTDLPSIRTWAELGVIFLMFTLGLEFSFRKLGRVGLSAGITATLEVLFFLPVGYWVARALGWGRMDGLFLGVMLAISSTTIIIKALEELKLKKHRFAELIFGVLIVEDLFAILLLVGLGTIASQHSFAPITLLMAALKLFLVVGGWFICGYLVVPRFMRYVGRIGSDEVLTLLSLGLCLSLVVFAHYFDYSTALGAFIMGSILAESSVLPRIERNMASLRDLFGAIFFVSIGMLIDPKVLWEHKGTVVILSLVTIVGKIVSTGLGSLISGQSLSNSVQVGFGLAQIGEFSFIIAQLGVTLRVTSDFLYPIAVAVSAVTTFTTPYLIRVSGRAAVGFDRSLPQWMRKAINQYAAHSEGLRAGGKDERLFLQKTMLRWGINGLTTSVLFVLTAQWVLPLLSGKFSGQPGLGSALGWLVAVLISSPFIWAMLAASRTSLNQNPLFCWALRGGTAIWVILLSAEFFRIRTMLFSAFIVLLVGFLIFRRRLEQAYRWFETRFLSSFAETKSANFGHLAPWEAHLVTLEVHPNSPVILKTISELAFRVRFGVNIIAIQRGKKAIIPPLPDDIVLPSDQLILLGTDQQVGRVQQELDTDGNLEHGLEDSAAYGLRQVEIHSASAFVGKTIRQSGIREQHHAMVVGLERAGKRTINPDSEVLLQEGDLLWIAGERAKLDLIS
jgi:CPA2 family monovalent cation:H+ antiporter-2